MKTLNYFLENRLNICPALSSDSREGVKERKEKERESERW